jgi:serine phosphatase RsbU (regulator of sigma subunit)
VSSDPSLALASGGQTRKDVNMAKGHRIDGRQGFWLAAIFAALTALAVIDIADDSRTIPLVLLVFGPLAASLLSSPLVTGAVGGYAVALTVAIGAADGFFLSERHIILLVAVAGAAILTTFVASVRSRLEAEQRRTATLLSRARVLADAGAVLDRSLNPDETLRQIASLAVPEHAAMCVIDILEEDGSIRGAAVEAADPQAAAGMTDMRTRFPLDPAGPHPVARVLRDERSTLIQLDESTLAGLAASGEHLEFMRRMQYHSAIVAPLRARNRTYGAISWLRFEGQPPYEEEDLELVEELASRAALALSNAHLFADAQRSRQRNEDAHARASAGRERAAFLAEAGVLLDQSLDFDTTLADLARLTVPGLADWCSIDVPGSEGQLRNVVIVHRDPGQEAAAKTLLERYPPRPDQAVGAANVMRTGAAEFLPVVPGGLLDQVAVDDDHREQLRALGISSALTVPLAARGRILGAMTLATQGNRFLSEHDLTLALELGARAGLSVDNARLYGDRAHVAQTLQASLLPPQLPSVPGMRVAARYRPAAEGVEVGGDFYDVFSAGPDRWVMVVGDVCGKGAEAAAVTALARYTLRADAGRALSPREALARLNAAMIRQQDDGRFLTLAYAVLSREGDATRLVVACAGHPPPVVLRNGHGSALLGHPGSLLGIFEDPSFVERSVLLEPGDSAVFYTDGVTEGNPGHRMTPDELAARLAPHGHKAPDEVAREVERAALGQNGTILRDDLAVLVTQRDR